MLPPLSHTLPPAVHAAPQSRTRKPALATEKSKGSLPANLAARLAGMEQILEKNRRELHVSGASLVIVKDGKVVYMKGLGLRDIALKQPVTPDTLFAIGSSTKAFTAMTVMMSVDDGKLALTDSPHKYLPYFTLSDPDADARITISDLLCHRSGLARTDMAWASGKLTAEEVIRLAGQAKPTAKLGEKFQYQNVMVSAAGQIVGEVQHAPWTSVLTQRILKPLGMNATNTSSAAMRRAADFAMGYVYNPDTKQSTHLPMRNLECIAPAGAINSNARDMARWLEFMLAGGVYNGKRLVSEKSFAELTKERIRVAGNIGYGYGWMLEDWKGHKVVEHGGNIDGFSAEVALMPDQKLGFVLLTNENTTPLASLAKETIWESLLGAPKTPAVLTHSPPSVDPSKEVGVYQFAAASLDVTVAYKDHALTLSVPGQPTYTLENVGDRRYKLAIVPGFFATFRPAKSDPKQTELLMEQPQGNFVAVRGLSSAVTAPETAAYDGPLKELIGSYANETPRIEFTVAATHGKVLFSTPGQPALTLVEKAKDQFALEGLPDTFGLTVQRNAAGGVSGLHLTQPQGALDLKREQQFVAPMSAEELMRKVIDALGGEANLSKHHALKETFTASMENQGLTGNGIQYARAPASSTTEIAFSAFGKAILTLRTFFDGDTGGAESSLGPSTSLSKIDCAEKRIALDFNSELKWRTLFKTVEIKRLAKVGEEEAYVVEMTPVSGKLSTRFFSTKSFLTLKQESVVVTPVGAVPMTSMFGDYREVDGVKVPFLQSQENAITGKTVMIMEKIEFDVPIPTTAFKVGK